MEVVEEVDEADEGDDKDEVDEGLDGEAEGRPGFGGSFVGRRAFEAGGGCGSFSAFEAVGDPLVDCPEEEEEDEADDPGADYAAGLDVSGEDIAVEQADSRHEEGAEKGEEDLSAGGSVFGGRCWQWMVWPPEDI